MLLSELKDNKSILIINRRIFNESIFTINSCNNNDDEKITYIYIFIYIYRYIYIYIYTHTHTHIYIYIYIYIYIFLSQLREASMSSHTDEFW